MKRIGILGLYGLFVFGIVASAQGNSLQTFFNSSDLVVLERLIGLAEANDLAVLELESELASSEQSLTTEGRLAEALNIKAGGSLSTDLYQQARPSFNISVSLNVMDLVGSNDKTALIEARIAEAKDMARVKAVEAYVAYKISVQTAEGAARTVEAAQAAFEVIKVRVETGDAILSNQIRAQSDVADAATALLTANGAVIVKLEKLATVVGLEPEETMTVLNGGVIAGK